MLAHRPPAITVTRADLRRVRPGRGPTRATPIRFFRDEHVPPGARPARSRSGRYLYLLVSPLPMPAPGRPAYLPSDTEVG